jgi:hypothetical protein
VNESMLNDIEKTKKDALESALQIPREQIPSVEEITKELLDGNTTHKKKSERPYNKIEGGYTKW